MDRACWWFPSCTEECHHSQGSIHLGTRDILGCTKKLKKYPFQAYQLNTNTGILHSNCDLFDRSRFPRKETKYCKYFTNYQQIHEIFIAKFYNYNQTHIFTKICDHGNLRPYGNFLPGSGAFIVTTFGSTKELASL